MKQILCRAVQPRHAQVFVQHNHGRRQTAEQMFRQLMILFWTLSYLIHRFWVVDGRFRSSQLAASSLKQSKNWADYFGQFVSTH